MTRSRPSDTGTASVARLAICLHFAYATISTYSLNQVSWPSLNEHISTRSRRGRQLWTPSVVITGSRPSETGTASVARLTLCLHFALTNLSRLTRLTDYLDLTYLDNERQLWPRRLSQHAVALAIQELPLLHV